MEGIDFSDVEMICGMNLVLGDVDVCGFVCYFVDYGCVVEVVGMEVCEYVVDCFWYVCD